jgi:hypothetical protein
MIYVTETTPQDVEQIREWLEADPWHKDDPLNDPELMVTGHGVLSFCLQDEKGLLVFIKLTEDDGYLRISMQFGPEHVVSKRRLIVGLAKVAIPMMKGYSEGWGCKGLVFESENKSLIDFAAKHGFVNVEGTNDFRFLNEEQQHV